MFFFAKKIKNNVWCLYILPLCHVQTAGWAVPTKLFKTVLQVFSLWVYF